MLLCNILEIGVDLGKYIIPKYCELIITTYEYFDTTYYNKIVIYYNIIITLWGTKLTSETI